MQEWSAPVEQNFEGESEAPSIYMSRARSALAQVEATTPEPFMEDVANVANVEAPAAIETQAATDEPADAASDASLDTMAQTPAKAPARSRRPRKPAAKKKAASDNAD